MKAGRKSWAVIAALALCTIPVAIAVIYSQGSRRELSPSSSMALSEDNIALASERARRGDADAAARLSRHFLVKKDYRMAYEWMLRAERLGHANAAENLKVLRDLLKPEELSEILGSDSSVKRAP